MSKSNPSWADDADLYAYARELHAAGLTVSGIARALTWRCHCDPPITKNAVCGIIRRRHYDFAARGSPIVRRVDEHGNRLPPLPHLTRDERKRKREEARKKTLAPVTMPPAPVALAVAAMAALIEEAAADVVMLAQPFVAPARSAFLEPWHTQCRYLSGERPNFVQCTAERVPTLGNGSYCKAHHNQCLVRVRDRREDDAA